MTTGIDAAVAALVARRMQAWKDADRLRRRLAAAQSTIPAQTPTAAAKP
jgi:hypothetical protein